MIRGGRLHYIPMRSRLHSIRIALPVSLAIEALAAAEKKSFSTIANEALREFFDPESLKEYEDVEP